VELSKKSNGYGERVYGRKKEAKHLFPGENLFTDWAETGPRGYEKKVPEKRRGGVFGKPVRKTVTSELRDASRGKPPSSRAERGKVPERSSSGGFRNRWPGGGKCPAPCYRRSWEVPEGGEKKDKL